MKYFYYDEWGVKRVADDSIEGNRWLLGLHIGLTWVAIVLLMLGVFYVLGDIL